MLLFIPEEKRNFLAEIPQNEIIFHTAGLLQLKTAAVDVRIGHIQQKCLGHGREPDEIWQIRIEEDCHLLDPFLTPHLHLNSVNKGKVEIQASVLSHSFQQLSNDIDLPIFAADFAIGAVGREQFFLAQLPSFVHEDSLEEHAGRVKIVFIYGLLQVCVIHCIIIKTRQPVQSFADPYLLPYFLYCCTFGQQQFQVNKTMFTRTREITPSSHQYRSVKYKVTQDGNIPLLPTSDFQTVQVKQMSRTFHTSWGRGTRYSMRKDDRRELFTAEMPEDVANDTRLSYMNTLDKLFLSSERRPNSSRKDAKLSTLRVNLPNIVDCEPSLFTNLEPMTQPLDFIERGVETLKKEMTAHKMQIAQLHHNIQGLKASILIQLDETKKHGERQMERLSKLLKADSVEFQESQLRFRRQCGELRKGDDNLRRNFQAVKQRESSLQTEIFSSRPFELARNEQLNEQFPQQYF